MPTACLNQPRLHVSLDRGRLCVRGPNQEGRVVELRQIPIRDVDRVIAIESVQFTSEALSELLREQIPVTLLGHRGQFLGSFLPAINSHGQSRLLQYQRQQDQSYLLTMAGRVVTAKIYNQRRVIQRLAANRQQNHAEALLRLEQMLSEASRCQTLDELRGCEGAASARYFQLYGLFFPAGFPFEHRSRRPPHNPPNACISFASTLLYHEMTAFLHSHGLDPSLGMLHHTENGRWSLALDLMEPFRPILAEALALDVFTHKILNENHFESAQGGVYLNTEGRRKFLLQYERRMDRQFFSEALGHRTTLRQQLEQQAVRFKSALDDPDKFEPFLMN
jgi:CRISPR-associated protein Cas1